MTTIKLRRGTAAEWTSANSVLAQGEPGLEMDTGYRKYGDGVTPWKELGYAPVPTASLASSVVSVSSGGLSAPPVFYGLAGGAGPASVSIGGTMPNLQPASYSNTALGTAIAIDDAPASGNLVSLTTGFDNTAIGAGVMAFATTSHGCVSVGADSMALLTTGYWNTALGAQAAENLTTGYQNTAVGQAALNQNQAGLNNTAVGYAALESGATGSNNTAVGVTALQANTASNNTAMGFSALEKNTTGTMQVAVGYAAAQMNTTGSHNTAIGFSALNSNVTSNGNTAVGALALQDAVNAGNTAVGYCALQQATGYYGVAVGYQATDGAIGGINYNTSLGAFTNATANGSVALGCDHTGAGASSAVQDQIAIGTANHTTLIAGTLVTSAAALATTATTGFLYIPTCAGPPTGVPTAHAGTVPLVFDTTDNCLYVYTGGAWSDAFTA